MVGECVKRGNDTALESACESIKAHIKMMYRRAGLKESFSHSGSQTIAGKVSASTGDLENVVKILGHSSIDCSQRYVDLDPRIGYLQFKVGINPRLQLTSPWLSSP
jgi:hypothetical protein